METPLQRRNCATDAPFTQKSTFPASLRGKRILLCTESFGPVNGVSRTTLMLVNHLRANGVAVVVVAPRDHTQGVVTTPNGIIHGGDISSNLSHGLTDSPSYHKAEVRVSGYPLPFNPELTVVYPVRLSELYRRAFGGDLPHLIYLASPASIGFQVLLQLRQHTTRNQIPVICNFQTDLAGYCYILFPFPLSTLAAMAFDTVQGFLFRHPSVKTIFYPSRFTRRYLERNGVADSKLELVQRGVDTAIFNPCQRSDSFRKAIAPLGEVILVCVARLAGEKGFGFLAAVAEELDTRGVRFKLCIVGGNRNSAVESDIRALFGALVEKGKVIFLGFRMGKALATAYASSDVFLHCSVTETFGLVVLESMASGVPVIARDEGGPSDIIQSGYNGYLVAASDLSAFVDKVINLVQDARLRRQLGKNARQHAEGATWEEINNKISRRIAYAIESTTAQSRLYKSHGENSHHFVQVSKRLILQLLPHCTFQSLRLYTSSLGSLAIISAFWILVGGYLIFIKTMLWVKG